LPFAGRSGYRRLNDRPRKCYRWIRPDCSVAAGTVLAREGDLGDEFFVIASGTAEVTSGGAPVAKLGAGDFFG